jgi:hypothetical protein
MFSGLDCIIGVKWHNNISVIMAISFVSVVEHLICWLFPVKHHNVYKIYAHIILEIYDLAFLVHDLSLGL